MINHIVGIVFVACTTRERVPDVSQKMPSQALEECSALLTFGGVLLFNMLNEIMLILITSIAQCAMMSKPLTCDIVVQEEKGQVVAQVLDQLGRLCMQSWVD